MFLLCEESRTQSHAKYTHNNSFLGKQKFGLGFESPTRASVMEARHVIKGQEKEGEKNIGDSLEMDRSSDVHDRKLIYGASPCRLRATKPPCSYYLRGRSRETVQELHDGER